MKTLISILILLPSLLLAGPVTVLEIESLSDTPESLCWLNCADNKAVELAAAKYVGKGGLYEFVAIRWRWHSHLQDGRVGGGPSCEVGPWNEHKPAVPMRPIEKLEVESTAARHFTDFAEKMIVPVTNKVQEATIEASLKAVEFAGKPTDTKVIPEAVEP